MVQGASLNRVIEAMAGRMLFYASGKIANPALEAKPDGP
jgi:hypothetical protein